jgi:hypothetical protein
VASYYNGSSGGGAEIRASNGFSSTVPVYAFWFNNNTGIGNPALNTISTIINGAELSRLTSTGVTLTGLTSAVASGDLAFTDVQNAGGSGYSGGNQALLQYSNDSSSAFQMFYKSRSSVKGVGTAVQNNDDIGELSFQPEGGAGPVKSALINAAVDSTLISTSSVAARLMFWTMPAGGNFPLERLRITSSGNVGIGTTTPSNLLSVGGSASIGADYNGAAPTNGLIVEGNVGIGTTNPVAALHVVGSAFFKAPTGNTTLSIQDASSTNTWALAAQTSGLFTLFDSTNNKNPIKVEANTPTNSFYLAGTGNVGIGTSTPGSILSLNNVANFTSATSTFYSAGGLNLSAGCFAIGGNCLGLGNISGTLAVTQGGSGSTTLSGILKGSGTAAVQTAIAGTDYLAPSSLSATYPLLYSLGTFSIAFGTTTSNTWSNLQTFANGFVSQSSSTIVGNLTASGDLAVSGVSGTSTIASGQGFTIGGSQFALQQGSGRVGIGTAAPSYNLTVAGSNAGATQVASYYNGSNGGGAEIRASNGFSSTVPVYAFWFNNNTGIGNPATNVTSFITNSSEKMRIDSSGNVGIGTSTPYSRLSVWGSDTASSTLIFNIVNSASTTLFAVFDGGNAQLSGTLTQSSDRRLKTNIQSLDASTSLAAINSLSPVAYDWVDPEKGGVRQYGFIAQQVQQVFPNLVSTTSATALTPDGTLGLNYLGLIAPLVEAVQTLSSQVSNLASTVAGFAQSFTSDKVTTKEICVEKSDGSTVCVSGDQLAEVLSDGSSTPQVQISAATSPVISGTTTPPSINIQGSNPATIDVGDTYTDLGAIVHDNQGHDLSYRTFINGVLSGNILIDTSQIATDTIDYVATDNLGKHQHQHTDGDHRSGFILLELI